ncbi:MAG TPA: hypothetical protein VFH74_12870 [Gaiellales bacterium]|nr:hypothetical protein [Gaiellales bacterium]
MRVVPSHVRDVLGKRAAWAGAIALLALAGGPAQAAVTSTPLIVDPSSSALTPAATATQLAWEQNSAANPSHWDVRARNRAGGASWKVNGGTSSGYNPSVVQGTANTIIYQQAGRTDSNLVYYNLSTKTRTKLPDKVDSPLWEYDGVASTSYVAFMRYTSTSRVLLLYKRSSGRITEITSIKRGCDCLRPTWVGSSHLVYEQCSASTFACTIRVLTIGGSAVKVPRGAAPYDTYGGVLDEATGDLYFVNSTTYCGIFASVSRWNVSGSSAPEVIVDFPEGIDGNNLSLAPDQSVGGDSDLLYSQYDCIANDSDVYEVDSVNQIAGAHPPSLPRASGSGGRLSAPARLGGSPPAG